MPKWTFHEPIDDVTYVWPINPSSGNFNQRTKRITNLPSVVPGGNLNIFEGRPEPVTNVANGTVLEEEHYEALRTWYNKRRLLYITDDLEREFVIYIKSLQFQRVRGNGVDFPWRHDYTMEYVVTG